MKYLILVSHGGLAEGLKSSLSMFASDKVDDVIAIGLKDGESLAVFSVEVKNVIASLDENDSVLVLADIVGGKSFNNCCNSIRRIWKIRECNYFGRYELNNGTYSSGDERHSDWK